MKEFNIKRHYETCHSKHKEYVGESRKLKIKNLKSGFEQQTNFFREKTTGLPEFRILPDFRHFALQIDTYRYYFKNELFLGGWRQSSAVKDNKKEACFQKTKFCN